MKRRFIGLLIPVMSLLIACKNHNIRSDIKEFIASFSSDLAIENYPAASYTREEISIENSVTSKVVTTMSIDRKNPDDLAYDYTQISYENDEQKNSVHRYIEKNNDQYFYITESQTLQRDYEQVNDLINSFFYTSVTEGIHTGGMFMGDSFRDILPDIQDLVTIDSENKLLVYSYERLISEQNKEVKINQTVTLDQYGMLVKEDMQKTSDLGVHKLHIEVKKL